MAAEFEQQVAKAELEGRFATNDELFSIREYVSLLKALRIAANGERVTLGLPTSITAAPGYATEPQMQFEGMSENELWAFIKYTDALIAADVAQNATA